MEREKARQIAKAVGRMLEPAVEHWEIAGSIRRGVSVVGDIEIVCTPRFVVTKGSLFAREKKPILDRHVEQLTVGDTPLEFDHDVKRNGPRIKRLIWAEEIVVELYVVMPPASWGAIYTIRTGPADFSRTIVTKRAHGGAMPDDLRQENGVLQGPSGPIDTPTEEDYFAAIGVPYWLPCERTEARLLHWLKNEGIRNDAGPVSQTG